ncbi:MAG: metallophosphoesterase, partial [Candidatus Aenigmatarchaeota archaeon]
MKKETFTVALIFTVLLSIGLGVRLGVESNMETVKTLEGDVTIGVLSDTHIPTRASGIPEKLLQDFRQRDVDVIIHAGDLVSSEVKEQLEKIAPVVAVCGNMDPEELCEQLPEKAVVKVDGKRIGVVHNTVNPLSDRMRLLAEENELDV